MQRAAHLAPTTTPRFISLNLNHLSCPFWFSVWTSLGHLDHVWTWTCLTCSHVISQLDKCVNDWSYLLKWLVCVCLSMNMNSASDESLTDVYTSSSAGVRFCAYLGQCAAALVLHFPEFGEHIWLCLLPRIGEVVRGDSMQSDSSGYADEEVSSSSDRHSRWQKAHANSMYGSAWVCETLPRTSYQNKIIVL